MNRFDEILLRYRWPIGLGLVLIILAGAGFLVYQSYDNKRAQENTQIAELKNQNEALRLQLAVPAAQVAGATDTVTSVGDKININTATTEELDKLPSIGPVYASAIVSYRQDKGTFQSIEELKNVKGIGDKTFEKLANLITVGE